jgi:hypothetical protein
MTDRQPIESVGTETTAVHDDYPRGDDDAADGPPEAAGRSGADDMIQIDALAPGDSPRSDGVNMDHVRALMQVHPDLPPIVVHRPTMRVIDGMHRLRAAHLRGDRLIRATFVAGSDEAAFVLAVQANISHGLPLSLDDRRTAARRIVRAFPHWSDREIGRRAGLAAATVAGLRSSPPGCRAESVARVGRDGRVRPRDVAEGRRRARQVLAERPDATVREIALAAGISVGTAHDVRERIEQGQDVVPVGTKGGDARPSGSPRGQTRGQPPVDGAELASRLHSMMRDPALRYSELGRELLRWLANHGVQQEDVGDFVDNIPPHCLRAVATLARGYASIWLEFAAALERREHSTA